jgi:hypothetical protein
MMMNSLARALRRTGAYLFLLGNRLAKPGPRITITDEEFAEWKRDIARARRGIPAADRGDRLDDWPDTYHEGEVPGP